MPTLPAVTLPGVTLPGLGGSLVSVSLQANLELLNGLLPALLTLLPLLLRRCFCPETASVTNDTNLLIFFLSLYLSFLQSRINLALLPALLGALPLLGLPANLVNIVGDLQANLGVLGGVLPTVLSLVQTLLPVLGALPAGLPSLPVTLPSLLPQVANVMVDLQASLGGLDSVLQTVLGLVQALLGRLFRSLCFYVTSLIIFPILLKAILCSTLSYFYPYLLVITKLLFFLFLLFSCRITSRRSGDATTNNDSHTPRYATTYHSANYYATTYHGANCDATTYHGANCDATTGNTSTGNASTGDSNTVGFVIIRDVFLFSNKTLTYESISRINESVK